MGSRASMSMTTLPASGVRALARHANEMTPKLSQTTPTQDIGNTTHRGKHRITVTWMLLKYQLCTNIRKPKQLHAAQQGAKEGETQSARVAVAGTSKTEACSFSTRSPPERPLHSEGSKKRVKQSLDKFYAGYFQPMQRSVGHAQTFMETRAYPLSKKRRCHVVFRNVYTCFFDPVAHFHDLTHTFPVQNAHVCECLSKCPIIPHMFRVLSHKFSTQIDHSFNFAQKNQGHMLKKKSFRIMSGEAFRLWDCSHPHNHPVVSSEGACK